MAEPTGPTVWASLGVTINLGNFENQKVDIGVAGIKADADPVYLSKVLSDSSNTLNEIIEELGKQLMEKVNAVREGAGLRK